MTNFSTWLANRDQNLFEAVADKEFLQNALEKGGLHKLNQILDKTNKLYTVDEGDLDYLINKIENAESDQDYHSPYFLSKMANELEQNFNNLTPRQPGSPKTMSRSVSDKVAKIVYLVKKLINDHTKKITKGKIDSIEQQAKNWQDFGKPYKPRGRSPREEAEERGLSWKKLTSAYA